LLVAGAGNYGLRHLQSFFKLPIPCDITVLGRRSGGQQRIAQFADQFANQFTNRMSINYIHKHEQIQLPIDLAIVATCSDVRFELASNLIEYGVRQLLLEKILFNDLRHYQPFIAQVELDNARVWVNTKKRSLLAYRELKSRFEGEFIEEFSFSGVNTGLASNAIHIIDLVEYMTGARVVTLCGNQLDKHPVASKRTGFLEFRGKLTGRLDNGTRMSVIDRDNCEPNKVLEIIGERTQFKFNEQKNRAWINGNSYSMTPEIQSELTRNNLDILKTGSCGLTDLHNSTRQHELLLSCLLDHQKRFKQISRDSTVCAIT